jgi:hypothetical protein
VGESYRIADTSRSDDGIQRPQIFAEHSAAAGLDEMSGDMYQGYAYETDESTTTTINSHDPVRSAGHTARAIKVGAWRGVL